MRSKFSRSMRATLNLRALAGRQVAPTGFPRLVGRFDGCIHVRVISRGDFGESLLRGRVDQFCAATGGGIAPSAIDEELGRELHKFFRATLPQDTTCGYRR